MQMKIQEMLIDRQLPRAELHRIFGEFDTSGDGFVDEDELVVLCLSLTAKHGTAIEERVMRKYLVSLRTEPSTPLNLDFDDFVDVYNKFVHAQASGKLVRMQTEANLGAA